MVMRTLNILAALLLFAAAGAGAAADIRVHIDREPVRMNESFSVTFEADSWIDGDPNLSPLLEDFEILGTSQNTLLRMHDSDITRSKTWTVRLVPKRTGELTIPAIHFGDDVSQRATVRVVEATSTEHISGGDVFVELDSAADSVYRNAQLLVTVRLFRAVNTRNSSLTEPEFEGGNVLIERLDENTYESWRGGRRYAVLERRYAVFPQTSGTLRLKPVKFRGEVISAPTAALDPFDRDPTLNRSGRDIKVLLRESRALDIEVKPPPAAAGDDWLPVSGLRLEENWSEQAPSFEVGKPVTRALTLTVEGMAAEELPELAGELPQDLRRYPEQAQVENEQSGNGLLGRRTERYALIPTRSGTYRLPPISVRWFDTGRGEFRTAEIPERTIEVAPAAVTPAPITMEPAAAVGGGQTQARSESPAAGAYAIWPWISALLAIGWLLTLWLWWRQRRAPGVPAPPRAAAPRGEDGLRRLQAACALNAPGRARAALLEWGRAQLGEAASLADLAAHYGAPLAGEIDRLNAALYGRGNGDWQGQALAKIVRDLHKAQRPRPPAGIAELTPLYRP